MAKEKEKTILSKRSGGERVVFGIAFVLFSLYALTILVALFFIVTTSLKGQMAYIDDIANYELFKLPAIDKLDFANYIEVFGKLFVQATNMREIKIYEMFWNSVWYTVGSSALGVLGCSFTGYILSKYNFIGRNAIYTIIIFTMTIPILGSTGSTLRMITNLGMYNSPLFLATAFGGFGFNFMILYATFKGIPWSFAEAVFIDGGGHFTVFFKIMLPQAKASLVTLFVIAAVAAWNDYTTSILYMPDLPTIGAGLYRLQEFTEELADLPLYYAGLVIMLIPSIIIFACFSDMIMHNFTVGGLKG